MTPILYSFRRCPYAMRARLALAVSGVEVELREIVLRDKAPAFLTVSPSATVPCLDDAGTVIDESLDIMFWALGRNDPQGWLDMPIQGSALISEADGPFKSALDHTKYHSRYPERDPQASRAAAMSFLGTLETQLDGGFLFGSRPTVADMAILPFVRQFAFINKSQFDADAGPNVSRWLETFLASDLFATIMPKLPKWGEGDATTVFAGTIIPPKAPAQA